MALPPKIEKSLQATAALTYTELYTEGKSAANDPEEYPLAQISERLDARTCPLCRAVDGKIVRVGSKEYAKWRQPSHINCRRIMVYIHRDEAGTKENFQEPDPELIRKHGHYHTQPEKHAELRIPAEPAGRHLVVRRERNADGEIRTRLDWAPWWEAQSEKTRSLALQARGAAEDAEFRGKLQELGITHPEEPEQARRVALLGLRDRLEGWVTVSAKPAAPSKALAELEAEIAPLKTHEVAALYDGDGHQVFRKKGGTNYVPFTPEEVAQFKDGILTHNHPSGGSFSEADLKMAVKGDLAEIRAVGINDLGERHRYTLTRPETGWNVTAERVSQVLREIDAEVRMLFWRQISSGELSTEEANRHHWHEVMLRVAQTLGLDYQKRRLED